MPAVNEEMLIDTVNERDEPVGQIRRRSVFEARENFRVAHTFLFNSRGELLVQKLGATRRRHPGFWGSSVAAYLFAGETYEEAIRRRLRQELGIEGVDLRFVQKTWMNDAGCKKFIGLFVGGYDGPIRPDPSHIAEVEFLSLEDLRRMTVKGVRRFTPTFLHLLDEYLRQRRG